jgi:hypothetical protein
MLSQPKYIIGIIIVVIFLWKILSNMKNGTREGWGTSPATMIQLASSSGYYPYYRYGFGYQYPYYRYRYPFHTYYPMGYYPLPYGKYKYGLY